PGGSATTCQSCSAWISTGCGRPPSGHTAAMTEPDRVTRDRRRSPGPAVRPGTGSATRDRQRSRTRRRCPRTAALPENGGEVVVGEGADDGERGRSVQDGLSDVADVVGRDRVDAGQNGVDGQ